MTGALMEKAAAPAEDMDQYLKEIRQYPMLTPEAEKSLAARCAAGDEEAIREMVNSNLRLVVSVAKGYAGRGAPLLDMIQEGSIGLITAARKFDPGMDCRFSTYATKWIRQGVSRCVTEHAGLIRVPRHTADQIKKLRAAAQELQRSGEPAELKQLAARCGITPEKAEQLLALLPEVQSLDAPAGAGNDGYAALLEDPLAPQPQEEMIRREMKQILEQLLNELTPRQRQVLQLRFGLDGGVCCTLEKTGEKLGISKERARQIERSAVEKLKKLGAGIGLAEFLE